MLSALARSVLKTENHSSSAVIIVSWFGNRGRDSPALLVGTPKPDICASLSQVRTHEMSKRRWTLLALAVLVAVLVTGTVLWGYMERQSHDDPKMDCQPGVMCY